MAGKETFLSKIGHVLKIGFVDVFQILGSAKGQQAIAGAEAIGGVVAGAFGGPAAAAAEAGIAQLVNVGIQSAVNVERLAAAAGQQSGTGAQKAAAAATIVASQAGDFLKKVGLNDATADEVQNLATVIANASAAILNAIPARAMTVSAEGPGPVVPPPPPPAA